MNSALLSEIGGLLVDVHGQGEHLSLLHEREHMGLLDRYAGSGDRSADGTELVRRLRGLRRELEGLRQDERERAPGASTCWRTRWTRSGPPSCSRRDDEPDAERRRLANAEQLARLSSEAAALLQEANAPWPVRSMRSAAPSRR